MQATRSLWRQRNVVSTPAGKAAATSAAPRAASAPAVKPPLRPRPGHPVSLETPATGKSSLKSGTTKSLWNSWHSLPYTTKIVCSIAVALISVGGLAATDAYVARQKAAQKGKEAPAPSPLRLIAFDKPATEPAAAGSAK